MNSKVYVVSKCCPAGCGVDVVLLSARHTPLVFAFCDSSGCTWTDPGNVTFDRGVNEVTGLPERAPGGTDLATGDQLRAAGFERFVLRILPERDWGTTLDELNEHIRLEVARGKSRKLKFRSWVN